jgi:hypothetical protein
MSDSASTAHPDTVIIPDTVDDCTGASISTFGGKFGTVMLLLDSAVDGSAGG